MITFEKWIPIFFSQVLYMSIIATVVGLVIFAIRKLTFEKISPKYHYMIWFAFLLALVFPITIPNRINIYNYIDMSGIKDRSVVSADTNSDAEKSQQKYFENFEKEIIESQSESLIKAISYIWFIVCMVKLIKIALSIRFLNANIGDYEARDERIIKILEKCKRKLKINKRIKIIKQDFVKTPSVIGIFDVKILFTQTGLELDEITLTNIIMHELSHYKRKDSIFNVLSMILKEIYWFNPILKFVFKYVKNDMELATDQMAMNHLEEEEKRKYCRSILKVIQISSFDEEPVLGMASGYVKDLEERIDTIVLMEKFEKHTKRIALGSIAIILLIWILLYPTSEGMFGIPKLYLKLENGEKIEAVVSEEQEDFSGNTIVVNQNDEIKLLTENGKSKENIVCETIPLKDDEFKESTKRILRDKIVGFETGEYIYQFKLNRKKNQTVTYEIKVVVK